MLGLEEQQGAESWTFPRDCKGLGRGVCPEQLGQAETPWGDTRWRAGFLGTFPSLPMHCACVCVCVCCVWCVHGACVCIFVHIPV